jgi:opacity protein-like surface antigen
MHKFLMTAATLLAFATPAFAGNCEVNLDQHNQLKVGMRYSQVVEILGCEGDLTFSAKGAGYKFENYSWEGLTVHMANGSVNSTTHHGLVPAGVAKPISKPIVINIDVNIRPQSEADVNPAEIGNKAIDAMPK